MATSYLTKSSKKKAAKGSSETLAKGGGEKEGGAKKKAAPKKTTPAAPKKTAGKGSEAVTSSKKTAAIPSGAKKTASGASGAGGAKKTASGASGASGAKKTASGASGAGGAKKTAFRDVPKESRFRGMSIEEWLKEKTSGWQAQAIEKIVDLVKRAAPDATATIKWGQPVFESNGPFAYIRPAKQHVTFGFWRGSEVADPKKLLDGAGDRMQHMKLAGLDQIDEKAITAMVKDAVRLNREKGTPTTRANR
jgi:hypothetical protein